MDSSSDGSFAWTDASDDTTYNDNMAKTNMSTSPSGEESESGRVYKQKLQQRLFSGSNDGETNDTERHHSRKRKHSHQHSDADNIESPNKRGIKTEPESDVDTRKVKKKHKSLEAKSQDVSKDSYDESYLDLKVKNEQNFAVPTPAKIKKSKIKNVSSGSVTSVNNEAMAETHLSHASLVTHGRSQSDTQIYFEEEPCQIEEDEHKCTIIKKHKKKKTKRKRGDLDGEDLSYVKDSITRDSFSAEDTVVEECREFLNNDYDEPVDSTNGTPATTVNKNVSQDSVKDIPNGNVAQKDYISHNSCSVSNNNTKRKSRLSERIRFEDDEDSDTQNKSTKAQVKTTNNKKSKLKSFVESSINLRPFCSRLTSALFLTDDDDVWVIRCPKDIKVEAFQDKKWCLDSKCKIKLDGQTYEGDVDDKKRNMTIVSSDDDRTVIKNMAIKGCVRLHRRIPKAHIQEDNIMVNNQNNFIPLPETKCRHPLFGLHYKKAIKLPSAVVERLRALPAETPSSTEQRKRKRDRRKSKHSEEASEAKPEPLAEPSAAMEDLEQTVDMSKKKKKKKRKQSESADESAPRRKRIKHDPESAEAWESEKAIEENLFNF